MSAAMMDFSGVGRLLSSPARSAMLAVLLRGGGSSAGDLAKETGLAPSTASEHLALLTKGGLIRVARIGRHRYYSLVGTPVAEALEGLATICPELPSRSLRRSISVRQLKLARTCYDHLAGAVGVELLDALAARGWLRKQAKGYAITRIGRAGLTRLGVDVSSAEQSRRLFARPCLDWSERRFHLAGALGAAVAETLIDKRWFKLRASSRSLEVTDLGRSGLRKLGLPHPIFESSA